MTKREEEEREAGAPIGKATAEGGTRSARRRKGKREGSGVPADLSVDSWAAGALLELASPPPVHEKEGRRRGFRRSCSCRPAARRYMANRPELPSKGEG